MHYSFIIQMAIHLPISVVLEEAQQLFHGQIQTNVYQNLQSETDPESIRSHFIS